MYPVIPSAMTMGAAQVVIGVITAVLLFWTFMFRARA
jgi:hypothetical protein